MSTGHRCRAGTQPQKKVDVEQLGQSNSDSVLEDYQQCQQNSKLNGALSVFQQYFYIAGKADSGKEHRHKNIL